MRQALIALFATIAGTAFLSAWFDESVGIHCGGLLLKVSTGVLALLALVAAVSFSG